MNDAADIAPDALMDRIYHHQRHIYDLTRRFYLLGRDDLIDALQPLPGDAALEIGCGTARNLIAAARRYPQMRFFGVDLSAAMLDTARQNVDRAGLGDRIMLAQGDAASFDPAALFGRARFERIFLSYSLSMIPPWIAALDHASAMVEPGGRLLAVDFGEQQRLPRWFRAALFAWLRQFHVTPRATLRDALQHIAVKRHGRLAFRSLYRDYARLAELRFDAR